MSSLDDALVLNVRGGARVAVPATLRQITPYVLLEQEDWFEDEIRFVRRWLKEGMRALDVGASFGLYSVAMARAVGASGRVWAFEPTAATAEYLQRNLRLNALANVEVSRVAISNRSGTVPFRSAWNSEENAVDDASQSSGDGVPAVTLDQASTTSGWDQIDFVKLDVEGHELQVIEGAELFLRRESPLVMLEVRTPSGSDLRALSRLRALGYLPFRLLPGALALVPFEGELDSFQLNLFACKPDRAEQLAGAEVLAASTRPVSPPEMSDWVAYVRTTPYAKALEGEWRSAANQSRSPARDTYLKGLAAFARAQDERRPVRDRISYFTFASQCVAEAIRAYDSPWRRLSYARLAWELGARTHATKALEHVAAAGIAAAAEPFLAPSPRYERVEIAGDFPAWLQCAVIEQFEKLRAHSSFALPQLSLAHLATILHLPQRSAEIDRRWQLARCRTGLQETLSSTPALLARSEDNLNPEFWSAAATLRLPAGS